MLLYETGFLLAPNLSEEETEKIIGQMIEVVSLKEGRLVRQERWGKRRLAYSIERFTEAFYVFFHYEGKPDIPVELERRFKQSDAVLRYLTLKKDAKGTLRRKKKKEPGAEEKAAPAAPAAEAPEPKSGAAAGPAAPESQEVK
jgi:small subunit ribosomal protein S6